MNTRFTATFTALALAGLAAMPAARAGDREWAVAGKVLTGIAAAHVISRAIEPAPTVVYQYAPAPVVYQTAPPVYVAAAPVAPPAPVYAPTTAVVYQPAPTVVYVAAPPPVFVSGPAVVIHPYGHYYRTRRCFSRW